MTPPAVLWQPPPDREGPHEDRRVPGLARARAVAVVRLVRPAVGMVGRATSTGSGGRSRSTSTSGSTRCPTGSSSASRCRARSWCPGATLNYAEHALRVPGRAGDDVVLVSVSQIATDGDADRRRASRPGGAGAGGPAAPRRRPRATGSRPTSPTSPKRSSRCWRPPASARSGRRAPPSSAPAAWSTASPRSSRPCCSPSTATATATGPSTGPLRSPPSAPPCRPCGRPSCFPYLDGADAVPATLSWERADRRRRRAR